VCTTTWNTQNRIVQAYGTQINLSGGNIGSVKHTYKTTYEVDPNGNITGLTRTAPDGNGNFVVMDSLRYGYTYAVDPVDGKLKLVNNKLNHVKDTVAKGRFDEDIDNQEDDNYDYTEIGEMKKDTAEGIDSIKWTVYGKIDEVFFSPSSGKHNLKFRYDALGNRVAKIANNKTTYYWRDAQGNTLAMETENTGVSSIDDCTTPSANTIEYSIYGSSRLGVYHDTMRYDIAIVSDYGRFLRTKTLRHYELTNHLGNVMSIVSDVKYRDGGAYKAHVVEAQDYFPYGMLMPGRVFEACEDPNSASYKIGLKMQYTFGFGGMLKDDDIRGKGRSLEFGGRSIYSPLTGRFGSVDPDIKNYPYLSGFAYANNSPMMFADREGKGPEVKIMGNTVYARGTIYIYGNSNTIGYQKIIKGQLQNSLVDWQYPKEGKDPTDIHATDGFNIPNANHIDFSQVNVVVEDNYVRLKGNMANAQASDLFLFVDYQAATDGKNAFENPSFVLGNVGYINFAQAVSTSFTTLIHELGHWLGWFNPNIYDEQNGVQQPTHQFRPSYNATQGGHYSAMHGAWGRSWRTPMKSDLGYLGTQFGEYNLLNPNQPNYSPYMGVRDKDGNPIIFKSNGFFTSGTQATEFSNQYSGLVGGGTMDGCNEDCEY
jgi:hypothetical protein